MPGATYHSGSIDTDRPSPGPHASLAHASRPSRGRPRNTKWSPAPSPGPPSVARRSPPPLGRALIYDCRRAGTPSRPSRQRQPRTDPLYQPSASPRGGTRWPSAGLSRGLIDHGPRSPGPRSRLIAEPAPSATPSSPLPLTMRRVRGPWRGASYRARPATEVPTASSAAQLSVDRRGHHQPQR